MWTLRKRCSTESEGLSVIAGGVRQGKETENMGQGYYFDSDIQRRFTGDIAETPSLHQCLHARRFIFSIFKIFLNHRNNILDGNGNSLTPFI